MLRDWFTSMNITEKIFVSIKNIAKAMHVKFIPALFFLLYSIQIDAQTKFPDQFKANINYHSGFILPEYKFLTLIANDYVRSLDVSVSKETNGKNIWEQLYNYPEYGISLFYSTLGNNQVLGKEFALTYFFKLYLPSKNRLRFYNRTGIGISYVNRIFNLEDNYMNVAVASHMNIHFNFRIGTNYQLSDKMELNAGISFDHLSDANIKAPNLGINYLTAFAGISYRMGTKPDKQFHEIKPQTKKNSVELFTSIGGKRLRSLASRYFITSSVSLEFKRELSYVFHFGAGMDLFYDSSVESVRIENDQDYRRIYDLQSGIHFSQTLVFNRFSLSLQEGIYLLMTDHKDNHLIYNRGIIQYRLSDKFAVRLAMKSHLYVLDYPEIGIGLKL